MFYYIAYRLLFLCLLQSVHPISSETISIKNHTRSTPKISSDSLPRIIALNPENGERICSSEVILAASLWRGQNVIDTASIRIFVDGREYTDTAYISSELVSLELQGLKSGTHEIIIQCSDSKGNAAISPVWNFTVAAAKLFAKPKPVFLIHTRIFTPDAIK